MNRTLKQLLLIDVIIRGVGLAGFTIFVAAIYESTGRASWVGYVGLASAVPSLGVLAFANAITARFSPLGLLRWIALARVLLFAIFYLMPHGVVEIMLAACLQSLTYQVCVSSKMTLDAHCVDASVRHKYLARKSMLGNVVVICAPALGGALVGLAGYETALLGLALASLLLAAVIMLAKDGTPCAAAADALDARPPHRLRDSFHAVMALPHVAAVVGTYCLIAIVLEIQAPLIFPFLREIYSAGSTVGGALLGLCGLGGIAGAYATEKRPDLFAPSTVPVLVLLDGLLFLCFTQIENLAFAGLIFVALGAMGSITLVLVEAAVQSEVDAADRPVVFSVMQFAAGAFVAALAAVAALVAERSTTRLVLSGAALAEIGMGGVCMLLMRTLTR